MIIYSQNNFNRIIMKKFILLTLFAIIILSSALCGCSVTNADVADIKNNSTVNSESKCAFAIIYRL